MSTPILLRNENQLYQSVERVFGPPNGNSEFNTFADVWKTQNFRLEITGTSANIICYANDDSEEEIHPVTSVSNLPAAFVHEWNAERGLGTTGEIIPNSGISNDPMNYLNNLVFNRT